MGWCVATARGFASYVIGPKSEREDSNLRVPGLQPGASATALHSVSGPSGSRTPTHTNVSLGGLVFGLRRGCLVKGGPSWPIARREGTRLAFHLGRPETGRGLGGVTACDRCNVGAWGAADGCV